MKTMTCNQLGGACDQTFRAETFEEMGELVKNHGMEMFQKGDAAHMKVMGEMRKIMSDPKAMEKWMNEKQEEFDTLQEDN